MTAQVGVAITQDAWWDRIPFVYRAMIGDAAIAASQRLDQALVETESSLFSRAKESGLPWSLSKPGCLARNAEVDQRSARGFAGELFNSV